MVPVWDAYADERLRDALVSLAAQDVTRRLLIVDNASTVAVAPVHGAEIVATGARLSLGAARNVGLAGVQTPFVVFWDADDLMPPETLAALEAGLDRDPRFVAFGMAIVESPSGLRHRWPRRRLAILSRWPRLLAALNCVWSQFPTTGAVIMRTDSVRGAGGYGDAESGEDWCLGVSLAFRGRIGWSEHPGRIYRMHSESVWARHMTIAHKQRHAGAVRARLRADPAVPRWIRSALPGLYLAQQAAIAAHAGLSLTRRVRRSRRLVRLSGRSNRDRRGAGTDRPPPQRTD